MKQVKSTAEEIIGKLRDELLNREIFDTLLEAQVLVEQWRCTYNCIRPHSSLRNLAPREYAAMCQAKPGPEGRKTNTAGGTETG